MDFAYKLGVAGYGNMASAILSGMIDAGTIEKSQVLIYDTDAKRRAEACKQGFICADGFSRFSACEYILLAVKPQNSADVFAMFTPQFSRCVVISIMAGVSVKTIQLSTGVLGACRCMPNSPAVIGRGITAVDYSQVKADKRGFIDKMFGSVGMVIQMREDKMDAVTAVSGSGPAYVYMFIDAFIKAAENAGLTSAEARMLVTSTTSGACDMVLRRNQDIPTLIDSVCSKGGTTIEAVKVLQESDLYSAINKAVSAAKKRAEQLSGAPKK